MAEMKNDGGPAFPVEVYTPPGGKPTAIQTGHLTSMAPGLSIRDWFAGNALAGMLASEEENGSAYTPDVAADRAYRMADAMILARSPSSPLKGE